jgi:hypothetical protein
METQEDREYLLDMGDAALWNEDEQRWVTLREFLRQQAEEEADGRSD